MRCHSKVMCLPVIVVHFAKTRAQRTSPHFGLEGRTPPTTFLSVVPVQVEGVRKGGSGAHSPPLPQLRPSQYKRTNVHMNVSNVHQPCIQRSSSTAHLWNKEYVVPINVLMVDDLWQPVVVVKVSSCLSPVPPLPADPEDQPGH